MTGYAGLITSEVTMSCGKKFYCDNGDKLSSLMNIHTKVCKICADPGAGAMLKEGKTKYYNRTMGQAYARDKVNNWSPHVSSK